MDDLEFLVGDAHGSKVVSFPSTHFSLGSAPDCELRFDPSLVKPKHAEVFRETDGGWWIRDISGSNTVLVNGYTSLESKLEPGTLIKVGMVQIAVRAIGKSGPHATATATPSRNPRPVGKSGVIRAEPAPEVVPDVTFRKSSQVIAAEDASGQQSHSNTNTNTGPSRRDRRHELQPGQVIDNRYKILGKLAAGGMGEVYKAEHIELGKAFAIKVMLPELSNDADFVARFKREAIASSRIGQQNIVDISDFGRTQEGRFFFVMEFIEGRTLASHVRREGPMTMHRVVQIGLQVARALAAAHAQSIVHRDLKPENVMLLQRPGQADFVKVLDFGIAKVSTGHGSGGQTAIGMVVGTPQYMSPEQAAGLQVDPRTDIYALGLILYELLAGRPAFVGETPSILMALQMTQMPPPLEPGPPKPVLPELDALVFHMLQKKVPERPASMEEVIGRLDEAMGLLRTATTGVATRKAAETNAALSAMVPIVLTQLPTGGPKTKTGGGTKSGKAPLISTSAVRAITGEIPPAAQEQPSEPVAGDVEAAAGIKPSKLPLFAGLAVLVLLAAVGVVFLGRDSKPTVVELLPPPPLNVEVKFSFKSVPDGAEVFDGDVMLGTTPFAVTRPKGHEGEFKFLLAGYKPASRKVRFEEDSSLSLPLEKLKDAPKDAPKDPPKETAKAPPKDGPKDPPKEAAKAPPRDAPKDPPKDAARPPPKDAPKEAAKETPKEKPKTKATKKPVGDVKELKDLPD